MATQGLFVLPSVLNYQSLKFPPTKLPLEPLYYGFFSIRRSIILLYDIVLLYRSLNSPCRLQK